MNNKVFNASDSLRNQEHMHRLIISQLKYDGYDQAAMLISQSIPSYNHHLPCAPSSKLSHLLSVGIDKELECNNHNQLGLTSSNSTLLNPDYSIDLEVTSDDQISSHPAAHYETSFITVHKAPATVSVFSPDGLKAATGSADTSIKVLDVERMLQKSGSQSNYPFHSDSHPVIRTLYDHSGCINTLHFHPRFNVLVSGSEDRSIKMFNHSLPATKKAYETIQEPWPIHCTRFHPGGDYLLVSTFHPVIRLYNIRTLQCYVGPNSRDHHSGPVNELCWTMDGKQYCSCSQDGSIKLWDGVTSKCINTFPEAHQGTEVCSVQFSKNSKYILSSGRDGVVRLWELSTGRVLNNYNGATPAHLAFCKAIFNHKEDYVLMPDEKNFEVNCWNSRNGLKLDSLRTGHNMLIRNIDHNPCLPTFLTCAEDNRVRCWKQKEMYMNSFGADLNSNI